jgi:L-malate glycosyltransferase
VKRAIHQFVAGYTNGDAISNEARMLRGVFRSWGVASEIFSETACILPQLRDDARDVNTAASNVGPADVVLLHLSMGSVVNEVFRTLQCRKALLYHNVTPAHYFEFVNPRTAMQLRRGREQVESLAGAAEVNLADSQFNAREIEALGYRNVQVLPLVLDLSQLSEREDRGIIRRFDDGCVNVLFVGRCVPNKRLEDALRAFALYHNTLNGKSRFIHVGSFDGSERYYYYLLTLARDLGISNVHFARSVPQDMLNAYYACADVFLCMSEHEGFCIPLMECMAREVPILAYAAAAVPETLDGAGILFSRKEFPEIAEMLHCLATRPALRNAVLASQRERLARYAARNLTAELREHLTPLLAADLEA